MKIRGNKVPATSSSQQEGVLVAHHGVAVEVALQTGERRTLRVKRRSGHVVGDRVLIKGESLERLPRRTELRRRDSSGVTHLVGANLDVLGVVISPAPLPPPGFIERAIVAARAAELSPFLVVNKSDLTFAPEFISAVEEGYAGAVPVFPLSAATGEGLDSLREFLGKGHRGAFIGTTGVGKSSLLNALCPEIDLRTGALNDHNGKGCHTTTVSTLHALSEGGELIDTPGFADFRIVDLTAREFALHFPGFERARGTSCRFRDCLHRTEPGCAVMELVDQKKIPSACYDTYLQLLGEVEGFEEEDKRQGWKN